MPPELLVGTLACSNLAAMHNMTPESCLSPVVREIAFTPYSFKRVLLTDR